MAREGHVCTPDFREAGERGRTEWPCQIHWIDSFAMRSFTNDAVFDDTMPAGNAGAGENRAALASEFNISRQSLYFGGRSAH
jgi:hypothetical protein